MAKIEFMCKIDALGRMLIPKKLREKLGWEIGDSLALWHGSSRLTVCLQAKNPPPECICCKSPEREIRINGKDICASCLEKALEQII